MESELKIRKIPLNGYFIFQSERRREMSQGGVPIREAASVIAAEWRKLDPQERQSYMDRARQEKEKQAKLLEKYKNTQTYKNLMEKLNQKSSTTKRLVKKSKKELSKSVGDETLGADIQIFSDQFLEHNKNRESKIRKLRAEICRLEDEEKSQRQNLTRLKTACDHFETELDAQKNYKRDLDDKYDRFSAILTKNFTNLPLPGFPHGAQTGNLQDYMNTLQDLVLSKSDNDNHALLVKCRDIASARSKFSAKEIGEYYRIFKTFDVDKNDKISTSELKNVMHAIGLDITDEEVTAMMKIADTDASGYIDFEEFLEVVRKSCAYDRPLDDQEIKSAFKTFDTNGDGRITTAELKKAVKDLGVRLTDVQIEQMIREADKSGDGVIDYNGKIFYIVSKKGF
uniref:Uncharacterized protein n=1 Tax=Romanomermis culicivorax TaxID=13658 RepID=A0A915L024_ROMCU